MSAIDIEKNKEVKKVKKRNEEGISHLTSKKKSYFSKIRNAIKKKKKK
jgi:hypothetical protein